MVAISDPSDLEKSQLPEVSTTFSSVKNRATKERRTQLTQT